MKKRGINIGKGSGKRKWSGKRVERGKGRVELGLDFDSRFGRTETLGTLVRLLTTLLRWN